MRPVGVGVNLRCRVSSSSTTRCFYWWNAVLYCHGHLDAPLRWTVGDDDITEVKAGLFEEFAELEELMIAVVERIEDQKDMQKGIYVEEVFSGKIPHMQAVEGALQHAKKNYAQSASTA